MAMDSSWDNSGLPAPKKGMPTWLKVLAGCGILMVLLIGSCVGIAAWGFHKVSSLGQSQWPSYVATVKALQDPASTKTLYENNPGLEKRFPDEAAFEQQVAEWRPAIQTPPDQMPSITTGRVFSFVGRDTHVQIDGESHGGGKHEGGASGYKMNDGRFFVVAWEDGKIVDVAFERRERR
jgi:hypothetical protein